MKDTQQVNEEEFEQLCFSHKGQIGSPDWNAAIDAVGKILENGEFSDYTREELGSKLKRLRNA